MRDAYSFEVFNKGLFDLKWMTPEKVDLLRSDGSSIYGEEKWHRVIQDYFDYIYSYTDPGLFIDVLPCLIDRVGFGTDGVVCIFPDWTFVDEDFNFKEGVKIIIISYGEDKEDEVAIISEEFFFAYVKLACEGFIRNGSAEENIKKIEGLMKKIPIY